MQRAGISNDRNRLLMWIQAPALYSCHTTVKTRSSYENLMRDFCGDCIKKNESPAIRVQCRFKKRKRKWTMRTSGLVKKSHPILPMSACHLIQHSAGPRCYWFNFLYNSVGRPAVMYINNNDCVVQDGILRQSQFLANMSSKKQFMGGSFLSKKWPSAERH